MTVSVIVPIFNCGKYLEESIPAILAQTHKDLELILVNDGSDDNSLEICKKYAERDNRIKIISKDKSEGAGPARNSGIDVSVGEYMMFIDSDDRIEPNMIELLLEAVTTNNCQVAVCGYDTYVETVENACKDRIYLPRKVYRNNEVKNFFAEYFPEGMAGYLWNKIYDATVIKANNLRFPTMRRLQDGVFNIDFFNCAESCCVIEDILYHYRINAQSDMFRKLPADYYDLIKQFSQSFIQKKQNWGEFSNEKIAVFLLNELGSCIENTFSKQWNMTSECRKKYFKTISEDEFFNYIQKEHVTLSKYRRLIINLMKKQNYMTLAVVVKTKTFVKRWLKGTFYFIKRKERK